MEERSYQIQLADYLVQQNGILFMPTGCGKTYIAILVLKRFAHQLRKSIKEGGKRTVFICNTVVLAQQQCKEIRKITNLKVGIYTGDRNVDIWGKDRWQSEMSEQQVLVGTPQIFVDLVEQGIMHVSDVNLVVIDECHHAVRNHPMHTFLASIQYVPPAQQPRVIGLTGVLLMGKKISNLHKNLENLEATFGGKIVTISNEDTFHNVMLYATKPREKMVTYQSYNCHSEIYVKIKRIVSECLKVVNYYDTGNEPAKYSKSLEVQQLPTRKKYIKNMLMDFIHQMDDYGLYTASLAILSPIVDFEIKKRQAGSIPVRNLFRYVLKCCEHIRHILVNVMKMMMKSREDEREGTEIQTPSISPRMIIDSVCNSVDIMINFSSSKMVSLLKYMTDTFAGKKANDISCLIFVQRRYSAKCVYYTIVEFLKNTPELRDIIFPQFMVGVHSINSSIESILDTNWSKQAIQAFHKKECNLIVCSNVLEEGIDIQSCNYVFVLDELSTFNSYIQTKGRARGKESSFVMFAETVKAQELCLRIKKFNVVHEEIRQYISNRVIHCNTPSIEETEDQFKDIITPYELPSGARLTSTSAVKLIYRYCQSLPHDIFGVAMPWFAKEATTPKGDQIVSIKLPLSSMIRETIQSDPMKTVREAKISASFKACLLLHKNGQLSENLLPITRQECVAQVSNELFQHWRNYNKEVTTKGFVKNSYRTITNKCPDELYNALPIIGQPCNAYPIIYSTQFSHNDYNEHIIDYLNTKNTYALLLKGTLPLLAEMPLFMTQGKISVRLSRKPVKCVVKNEKDMDELINFHTLIFRDILNMWKSFFTIDHRNRENSYLIVPMNEKWQIDWKLVKQFQHLNPARAYTENERLQRSNYRPEDYLGKVVTKWYNKNENERFIVTRIRSELSPKSVFCFDRKYTYADFFATRYGVTTVNPDQFLIEVKAITSRRNFFINALGKSQEVKRDRNEIILIPELCHNFQFPGDLWLKAVLLPTVLHRVYYMLHAEHIRCQINQFLQGKDMTLKSYEPLPLIIDTSLKRAYDSDENYLTEDVQNKKNYLPTLKSHTKIKISSANKTNGMYVPWKEYLEPIDMSRNINKLYSIEIDYYQKFINSEVKELECPTISNNVWTENQLEMPKIVDDMANTTANNAPMPTRNDFQLSSCARMLQEPLKEDQVKFDILERSTTQRHELKSAEQYEFLAAITTAKVGDVFDMERYELLGDAFLKFACSLYLVNKYPNWNEGQLSNIKGRMVSNRNLLYCMLDMDLSQRICGTQFTPNICWIPPLAALPSNLLEIIQEKPNYIKCLTPLSLYSLNLTEKEIKSGSCDPLKFKTLLREAEFDLLGNNETTEEQANASGMSIFLNKQILLEKVISDTLEALLGVCVKNYGIQESFQLLKFFGIVKPTNDDPLKNLLDLKLNTLSSCTLVDKEEIDHFLINHEYLERNLGYKFKNRAFLLQALTHPSYPSNRLTGCYQELEFVGDAILDMLITAYIFERFQNKTPGMITDLRMALVNNVTLACCCVRHRFHLFLLYENVTLTESIKSFVDFQETQGHTVTDNLRILMEENDYNEGNDNLLENEYQKADNVYPELKNETYNIADNVEVPKVLGDLVESLIAAVYMDSHDLKVTWQVIYNILEKEIKEFQLNIPVEPVRELMEKHSAKAAFSSPFAKGDLTMVICTFNCLDEMKQVHAFGRNAKEAKKAAAKAALRILMYKSK